MASTDYVILLIVDYQAAIEGKTPLAIRGYVPVMPL